MKRIFGVVAGLALAGAVFTATAEAQGLQFGLGGGLSMPTGDAGDAWKSGFHGQASAQFNPGLPFALRVDGMYHNLSGKSFGGLFEVGDLRVIAGTVNGLFAFGTPGGTVQPYATAGLGVYNLKSDIEIDLGDFEMSAYSLSTSASTTELGVNGGAGVRFNLTRITTFVEARYHHIMTDGSATQMIPLTVGVMFRR